jgi:hypothetical protein
MSHLPGDQATKRAAADAELCWWLQAVDTALERISLS